MWSDIVPAIAAGRGPREASVAHRAPCPAQASVPLPVIQQASGMPTLAPVLKKITPAVVSIAIKARAPDANASAQAARDAKPAAADQQVRAAGSGVVIDAGQGLIITNNHVIDRAEEITVQLADGRELPAKLIGGDPDTDVAVIKIAAENLTAITIGNSDQVEVGDFVLAIGNPFLIGQTVTSGSSAVCTGPMWASSSMRISSRPMRRSIRAIPAARSSICAAT